LVYKNDSLFFKYIYNNYYLVGMGTGSTCYFSLDRLDQLLKQHKLKEITVIPCSEFTKKVMSHFKILLLPNHNLYQQCIARNIPITTLSHVAANNLNVDIVIDGVDEIDPDLQMSKGGSGCLLREKMIESAATKVVIVADESKLTTQLGTGHPLSIEITPFSHEHLRKSIEQLPSFYGNARAILRRGQASSNASDGSEIAVTDNGHYIIDVYFAKPIHDVKRAAAELDNLSGIVEHGICVNMNPIVLIATSDKDIRVASNSNGQESWWRFFPVKQPLDRISLDNRQPEDFIEDE